MATKMTVGWLFWGSIIIVGGVHGSGLIGVPMIFVIAAAADYFASRHRSPHEARRHDNTG